MYSETVPVDTVLLLQRVRSYLISPWQDQIWVGKVKRRRLPLPHYPHWGALNPDCSVVSRLVVLGSFQEWGWSIWSCSYLKYSFQMWANSRSHHKYCTIRRKHINHDTCGLPSLLEKKGWRFKVQKHETDFLQGSNGADGKCGLLCITVILSCITTLML